MFLRLYPKFARSAENKNYLKKIEQDIEELKRKLAYEEETYKNTVFEDYYYISNNRFGTTLDFPFSDIVITKKEEVITMTELPKDNQKYVYLEFSYGGAEYKGYIPLPNYMVWSRNILDKTIKIDEKEYYQSKSIEIPNKLYRIDNIIDDIIYVDYAKLTTTEDQTGVTTAIYQNMTVETLTFTKDMLKNSFWDGTNARYLKEDLVTLFKCTTKKNKKYHCELPSGEFYTKQEKNVYKSDVDYDYYVNSDEWKTTESIASSVFGANEVGDEITIFKVGLPLLLKDTTTFTVTAINLNAVPFFPKFDYEDYVEYGYGTSNEILKEKIAELEKIRDNIIAQESMTFFDFPINKDYTFKLTDVCPPDEEIKKAVNNLAFGIPEKVTNLDNTTRAMNFREQEAFNQFGSSTLKTHSVKTNIKVNTIEGIIETSTISGILKFLRLLYLSTPKKYGNDQNIFMGFTDDNQTGILEYLQQIQDLINSDRAITVDIKRDEQFKEGNSGSNIFNLLTKQTKSYFELGKNIIKSAKDDLIGTTLQEGDDNSKDTSGLGFTADYVDFSLYEIVDEKEYFLFDSRNTYNDQSILDKILNNNTKFATLAVPALAGTSIAGITKVNSYVGLIGGLAVGGTILGAQELFGDKKRFDESKKEFETNFIISNCKFTFSSVSGKISDGLTFPTYVKYSINLETKKPPLLNDVLRMLLLQQMIVSEDRTLVDEDITKTEVDTALEVDYIDENLSEEERRRLESIGITLRQ